MLINPLLFIMPKLRKPQTTQREILTANRINEKPKSKIGTAENSGASPDTNKRQ
jgi:hypothetical protein